MKKNVFEIVPLQGLGQLDFGKNIDEVFEFLGKPDSVEQITDDEPSTTICFYEERGFTAFFEGEAVPTLSMIEIVNPKASLFGVEVFRLKEEEICELMRANGFQEEEKEVEEWGDERLSFNDALVDFYFEEGDLTLVNWGVLIDDDGEVKNPDFFKKS